jgi:predicted SprT family Zn-dependent metalloprotease
MDKDELESHILKYCEYDPVILCPSTVKKKNVDTVDLVSIGEEYYNPTIKKYKLKPIISECNDCQTMVENRVIDITIVQSNNTRLYRCRNCKKQLDKA